MRVYSSEITGPVMFEVGQWKTDLESFNMDLNFEYTEEDEDDTLPTTAEESQTAEEDSPTVRTSDRDTVEAEKRDFHTPSTDILVMDRHPQSINPPSNKVRAPRATPNPNDPEYSKRSYVLEVLRRNKLTRRELARRADVEDFRAMNYWLRGKDLENSAVSEAGRLVYDWAKRVKLPVTGSSAGGEGSKSPDYLIDFDEDQGEGTSPISASKQRTPLSHFNKRAKMQGDKQNKNFDSFTWRTPLPLEKRRRSGSMSTPVPLNSPMPVNLTSHLSGLPNKIGLTSPIIPFPSFSTPSRFYSSPTRPSHQTPSMVDASMISSSSVRGRSDQEEMQFPPQPSPFTSPTKMFEVLFTGDEEKMLDATPGLTPSVSRTQQQQLDNERAKRRLFDL